MSAVALSAPAAFILAALHVYNALQSLHVLTCTFLRSHPVTDPRV